MTRSRVVEYVTEEVERQGHDTTKLDGIERVAWMLNAWAVAIETSGLVNRPTAESAVDLGRLVEMNINRRGIRNCGVRVGNRVCMDHKDVPAALENLFATGTSLSPIEFYKRFELIHPFVDGNGRTGKILLNWLNGTLLDPIFPPNDLFGYPIRNP